MRVLANATLRWSRGCLSSAVVAVVLGATGAPAAREPTIVTIATAKHGGAYLPVGDAICRFVNAGRERHGLLCLPKTSAGSVDNIRALRTGQRHYAIVQSDVQHAAYAGAGPFRVAGPFAEVRALLALHLEPYTVVARGDAGIRHFADVKGRRFNLGPDGSGMRATAEAIVRAFGWTPDDFALAGRLAPREQVGALCANRIDVAGFTVGHPSAWIHDALTACQGVPVAIDGPAIDALLRGAPYYAASVLPAGTYANQPADVPTVAVRASLVTRADRPEDEVCAVVSAVLANLEVFRRLHPTLANLDSRSMVQAPHAAPLHRGAQRCYREHGLLP
jgi:hypothetical protein